MYQRLESGSLHDIHQKAKCNFLLTGWKTCSVKMDRGTVDSTVWFFRTKIELLSQQVSRSVTCRLFTGRWQLCDCLSFACRGAEYGPNEGGGLRPFDHDAMPLCFPASRAFELDVRCRLIEGQGVERCWRGTVQVASFGTRPCFETFSCLFVLCFLMTDANCVAANGLEIQN